MNKKICVLFNDYPYTTDFEELCFRSQYRNNDKIPFSRFSESEWYILNWMYDSGNFSCKVPSYGLVIEKITALLLSNPNKLPKTCTIHEHFACAEKYYLVHENYEMLIQLGEKMKLHALQWEADEKILAELPVVDASGHRPKKRQSYWFDVKAVLPNKNYIYDTHPIDDFKHTLVKSHVKYDAFIISLHDDKTNTMKSFIKRDLLYYTTLYAIYEKGKKEVMCFIQVLVGDGVINTIQYSIKNKTSESSSIIKDFIDEFAIVYYLRLNTCHDAYLKLAEIKAETMSWWNPLSDKLPKLRYQLVPHTENDDYYIIKTSTGEKMGVLLHNNDCCAYDIILGEKLLGSSDNFEKILSMLLLH